MSNLPVRDTDDQHKVEVLIKELWALNNRNDGVVPPSTLPNLQAFRLSAGFTKKQVLDHDKWLSSISLQSTLNTLSRNVNNFSHCLDKDCSTEHLLVLCDLLLETVSADSKGSNKLLNNLLKKVATQGVCCNSSFQTFKGALHKAINGLVWLEPDTIYHIICNQPSLLDLCCTKHINETVACSWLVNSCLHYRELYEKICDCLWKQHAIILPEFVERVRQADGKAFIALYQPHEQPCLIYFQALRLTNGIPMFDELLPASRVTRELLSLWITNASSAMRLINHFPYLARLLSDMCHSDVSAQRLCMNILRQSHVGVISRS